MTNCELCGKETQPMRVEIEGTPLNVCPMCAKHGKVLKVQPMPKQRKRIEQEPEKAEELVAGFSEIIRKTREKKGMTQEEFAKMLNEKESIIQKIENNAFNPTIEKAKRWQKILSTKLIEEVEEAPIKIGNTKSGALTIGDILKIK